MARNTRVIAAVASAMVALVLILSTSQSSLGQPVPTPTCVPSPIAPICVTPTPVSCPPTSPLCVSATPPQIDAGGPYAGTVGAPISFAATVNRAPPGSVVGWNFGDGSAGMGVTVMHAYAATGTYVVTASLLQNGIRIVSDTATVMVTAPPAAIDAGGPYAGMVGTAISFTATLTTPPPGYTVVWTFGDGATASGSSVSHTYAAAGSYQVTATLYLGQIALATDSAITTVNAPSPPTMSAGVPLTGVAGLPVQLAVPAQNQPAGATVIWDFGDGASGTGITTNHTYTSPGTYTAVATIYLDGAAIARLSTLVTVTPVQCVDGTVTYPAGWNLVSGPDGTVFSQADDPMYTLETDGTTNTPRPNAWGVTSGYGYWAKFDVATTVALHGCDTPVVIRSAPASTFIMIGNPRATTTLPVYGADVVYWYDPDLNNYVVVTTLAPGQGALAISLTGGSIYIGP